MPDPIVVHESTPSPHTGTDRPAADSSREIPPALPPGHVCVICPAGIPAYAKEGPTKGTPLYARITYLPL